MTAYALYAPATSSNSYVGIKAVTYPIKIVKVDVVNTNSARQWIWIYRYVGATLSGTTIDSNICPGIDGSPTATAQATWGTAAPGGTQEFIAYFGVAGGTGSALYTGKEMVIIIPSGGSATFQSALDVIISPGSAFVVYNVGPGCVATTYFEELHMPWA